MKILMIGATGFVGSSLVARLAAAGHDLLVATRRRERARHLIVLPTVRVVEADIHDEATLEQLMQGQDAVINLVGILKGGTGKPYGAGFVRAHVELPTKIVHAMQRCGVRRLLHMSALHAGADAPSGYLRSKAAGEKVLLAKRAALDVTVFRPSVIFGRGDAFLTLFAQLQAIAPFVPLACPDAQFQPVWVEDVTRVMAASLADAASVGKSYDLCGPTVYRLRQLVAYAGRLAGHARPILGLSNGFSMLQAWAMEFVPGGPMTRDNVRSMQLPSICASACGLPFGVAATPLEAIAPSYLAVPA